MNVLSHIQIKQVAYHFQFDKGLLAYFQGVAWAWLPDIWSKHAWRWFVVRVTKGLVNSKTVSVTTSPSNLTPRWDNIIVQGICQVQ